MNMERVSTSFWIQGAVFLGVVVPFVAGGGTRWSLPLQDAQAGIGVDNVGPGDFRGKHHGPGTNFYHFNTTTHYLGTDKHKVSTSTDYRPTGDHNSNSNVHYEGTFVHLVDSN